MAASDLQVRILGPLEVVADEGPVKLPRGRARTLLVRLAIEPGIVVSTARLLDDLWAHDPPRTAATALHGLVSRLRLALAGDPDRRDETALVTRAGGYVLAVEPGRVDAVRFRKLVRGAAELAPEQQARQLREALALWRGPALADVADEPFAQAAATELEQTRLAALEARIEADLELGRHDEVVGELERMVAEHPLRERLLAGLVVALERTGRRADALAAYREGRRRLAEVDLVPSPHLRALVRDLRAATSRLGQQPAAPVTAGWPDGTQSPTDDASLTRARKPVTVLFAEIVVDTAAADDPVADEPDPELHRRRVGDAFQRTSAVIGRHGGTVQGFIGDVMVAIFGIPRAREDDAARAVRAARALDDASRGDTRAGSAGDDEDGGPGWSVRIGINTGEVVVGDPVGTAASGDAVNLAAHLQQAAGVGDVLLGETTRQLVAEVAQVERFRAHRPDGRPVVGWRLVELSGPDHAAVQAPMVGRQAELARLRVAFDGAVRERRARLVLVTGEAGLGKTRLATEFAAAAGTDVRVLAGRCHADGDGPTLGPFRDILAGAAAGTDATTTGDADEPTASLPDQATSGDADMAGLRQLLAEHLDRTAARTVAGALGIGDPDADRGHGLLPALRTLFEGLFARAPALVTLDDLHWAQPTLLDLLEYLAGHVDAPVLFLGLARPELLEERPKWAAGGPRRATIMLDPLGRHETHDLVTGALAVDVLEVATIDDVVVRAGGNPLFAEQMLAALQDGRPWDLPASLKALLAARLDRLEPLDRDVLRCAAVIGDDVPTAVLRALVPRPTEDMPAALQRLVDQRLLATTTRRSGRRPGHRFAHALVRRAAYASLTHEDRADLHERVATWLDEEAPPTERDALVGHHLARAHDERRRLGLADAATARLAVRAGERLAAAGLRAFERFDMDAVDRLLSRARRLLPGAHPRRGEVMRVLLQAAQVLGRHDEARVALAELLDRADSGRIGGSWDVGVGPGGADGREDGEPPGAVASRGRGTTDHDRLWRLRLRIEQDRVDAITGPDSASLGDIHDRAAAALQQFAAADDHGGVADAAYVAGLARLRRGDVTGMADVADVGMTHARRSRDPRAEAAMRWVAAIPLLLGPTPLPEAIDRCQELLPWLDTVHPGVLADLGLMHAMRGDFDAGRDRLERARTLFVERFRGRRPLMFVAARRAEVEMLADSPVDAEQELRDALGRARRMGEADQVAEAAAVLSLVLSERSRVAEAADLADLSARHAPAESVIANARLLAARARVAAARGEPADAARAARRAVDQVPAEMPSLRADCLTLLATVLEDVALAEAGSGAAAPRPAHHAAGTADVAGPTGEVEQDATRAIEDAIDLYERKGNLVGAARARALREAMGAGE